MFKKEKEEVIHLQAHFKKNQKIREYSSHISKVHSVDWSADGSKLNHGILLPKLFWPTVRKNCSRHREKLLKFEAEGWEFSKLLRSLEQFIQAVKGKNNVC